MEKTPQLDVTIVEIEMQTWKSVIPEISIDSEIRIPHSELKNRVK
jgi:hypothetical protein